MGFLPIYVPRELLHAQGVLPVGLMGGRPDLEIIKGDAYYQSYICHLPRSTIELGLNGSYDALDGLIFPAICDCIRNLSGMWQMLFPKVLVHYLDVPQNFDPAIGGAFYRRDLEALAHGARGARRAAAHRRGPAALDRALQREPAARARAVRAAPSRAVEGADARALRRVARGAAPSRGGLDADVRGVPRARIGRRVAAAAGPGSRARHRLLLRAAATGADQDARARGLLHRGRRLRAGAPVHPLATSRSTAIRCSNWCRRSSPTRSRVPPGTSRTR